MTATPARRAAPRLTAFRAGLVAGLATAIAVPVTLQALIAWLDPRPDFNVEVLVNGADVDSARGARVVIDLDNGDRIMSAACTGPCDDLGYRLLTGDSAHIVQVLDGRGAVIAEGSDGYVDGSMKARVTVAGTPRLTVKGEYLPNPGYTGVPPQTPRAQDLQAH
jgi:hypothetical protein